MRSNSVNSSRYAARQRRAKRMRRGRDFDEAKSEGVETGRARPKLIRRIYFRNGASARSRHSPDHERRARTTRRRRKPKRCENLLPARASGFESRSSHIEMGGSRRCSSAELRGYRRRHNSATSSSHGVRDADRVAPVAQLDRALFLTEQTMRVRIPPGATDDAAPLDRN